MRMIGIGLMGFLLAGVALLLSTMNIVERGQRYLNELTDGPQLVFEDRRALPAAQANTATLYRSTPNHPLILSGLPSYQGVVFNMPMDARPTSGYLQIDATLQVLEGVQGVLRISIDNVRRGEMLLHPGEVGRSLRISLSPTDFARERLVVSFSLQGEGPHTFCSTDDGFDAVVEIETTSAVFLTLDQPLTSARDRVNAWGQIVRVGWAHWIAPEERIRRLVLATEFRQHNIDIMMVDDYDQDALSTTELRAVLPLFQQEEPVQQDTAWPMAIAEGGANAGLRRFERQTVWRTRFDSRRTESNLRPSAIELHLALGHQLNSDQWAVTVTLNNRLIHQMILEPGRTDLSTTVDLPVTMQSAINSIDVTLTSTNMPEEQCSKGPELIAEMLPETRLIAGETQFSDSITELRSLLSQSGPLTIGEYAPLTAADADVASAFLAQILPAGIRLKPNLKHAQIIVLPPAGAVVALPTSAAAWMVSRDPISDEFIVQTLSDGAKPAHTGPAILVVPSAMELPGVAS